MTQAQPPRSPLLPRIGAVVLVILLTAGAWWILRRAGEHGTSGPEPVRFLNAGSDVTYVGSQACAECHAEQFEAHAGSLHHAGFGAVDPATAGLPALIDHKRSAVLYRLSEEDGAVHVHESLRMEDGSEEELSERVLSWRIGSGAHHPPVFAAEVDGYWMQAPFSREGEEPWQISPAYDRTLQGGFSRGIDPKCLSCHAGRSEQVGGASHRFDVLEASIGCERCHGPGSLHIEHQRSLAGPAGGRDPTPSGPDRTIVQPGDMTPEQQMWICAACHMSPALTIPRVGHSPHEWQPALPWKAIQVTYRPKDRPDAVVQPGHVDLLRASRCYTESTRVTCLTCHDAHAREDAALLRTRTNRACAACHDPCPRPPADETPASAQPEDCAACHMPERRERAPHRPHHDHRIAVHRPDQPPPELPLDLEPVHRDASAIPAAERDRGLGLAYVQRSSTLQDPEARAASVAAAERHLEAAIEASGTDAMLEAGRATLAAVQGDLKKAEEHARVALELHATGGERLPPEVRVALYDMLLRNLLRERRGPEAAQEILQFLVILRLSAGDWQLMLDHDILAEELDRAREAVDKMLSAWPTEPGVQQAAFFAFRATGDQGAALRADRLALRLSRQQSYVAPDGPR